MDKPDLTRNSLKQVKITTVCYYDNITSKKGSPKNILDVLELIRTGNGVRNTITALRNETDKKKAADLKKNCLGSRFQVILMVSESWSL